MAALLVSESLAERDHHLHANVIHAVLSLAFVMCCCGALAMLLGKWLVAQPVRQLIDKARRVGRAVTSRLHSCCPRERRVSELGRWR